MAKKQEKPIEPKDSAPIPAGRDTSNDSPRIEVSPGNPKDAKPIQGQSA